MAATASAPLGSLEGGTRLGGPLAASVVLHAVLIALFFVFRAGPPPPSPPVYRVDLIAAPPGERAAGVVKPQPAPATPQQPPPPRPKTTPREMPLPNPTAPPRAKTPQATPSLPTQTKPDAKAPTPTAGGGETGGRGTDVVTVSTGGAEFPYPGYLENIVRQIALRFHPDQRGALRAEVFFLIQRDGTVQSSSIRLVSRSGVYSFDAEAQGAVEAAATAKAFGPLPSGYPNDALPVTFRFDPRILR